MIRAHPAARVVAIVRVADTGRPCPSGRVDLRRWIREHEVYEYDVASFDDGSQVEFSGLLPGTYDVEIECREYQAFDSYPPLVVDEHDIGGIDWRVSDTWVPVPDYSRYERSADELRGVGQHWTGKIRGRVVDETDTPVPQLDIHPYYRSKSVIVPHVNSDATGSSRSKACRRGGSSSWPGPQVPRTRTVRECAWRP